MTTDTATQYDDFADDYEWLYSQRVLQGEPYVEDLRPMLDGLSKDTMILDCACGTGVLPLALARRGFRNVYGTDASAGMIRRATRRAEAEQLDARFTVCPWDDLPARFDMRFDLVVCFGNSIGHCPDEESMIRSLRAMFSVLKPGGRFVLDSRNWEKIVQDRVRFTAEGVRDRDGVRCIPLYVWSFPETFGEELVIEVVFVFEKNGQASVRSYPITYRPYRPSELVSRLTAVGYLKVETDFKPDAMGYRVWAEKG
jgi:SAM-dependent methyltransferase